MFGSNVSVNCTPVASAPVAVMVTVYLKVSPGSALPSLSRSVNSASVLVAVTVGGGATANLGPGSKVCRAAVERESALLVEAAAVD